MGRLFGTDGARGIANTELTCEMAMQIGRAAAMVLTEHLHEKSRIIVGKDTRISSDMLEAALAAGICSVGADALLLGVVPTPAVAHLVKKYGAHAGVMISASHNPVEDNGIKLFSAEGYKLSDSIEEEIEAIILDQKKPYSLKSGCEIGRMIYEKNAADDYINHLISTMDGNLDGMRVAVDCANGSASTTARKLFGGLGASCLFLHDQPDGTNINQNCGSTHLESLSEFVKKNRCIAGLAFDGDADRCLAVDEEGNLIDGDKMIAIFARALKQQGKLHNDTAVVTVMSNLGFFAFAKENGISVATTKVGDRYVLEEMVKYGHSIGGEQSGHIIFLDHATTGDGQLSGIHLLAILKEAGCKMSKLGQVMERYPQVMISVKADAAQKQKYEENEEIRRHLEGQQESLGADGRILVRPSGTEPVIRVMVEGRDFEQINEIALDVSKFISGKIIV